MTNRILKTQVTFRRSFILELHGKRWPAGDYDIETEEKPLGSILVVSTHPATTTMNVVHPGDKPCLIEIASSELAGALARDRRDIDRAENQAMIAQ